ncbi:hypothetical protein SAMN05192584_11720 [Streptomyces pini]|uniref:Uncharacterized protein n=1 Tax=Streptomyces pini TaxID=1520580 RepID=A0A1I4GUY5_9ACTN|nr:hypothetical protein SAMN05192584_11720 [Streptomyces pini]
MALTGDAPPAPPALSRDAVEARTGPDAGRRSARTLGARAPRSGSARSASAGRRGRARYIRTGPFPSGSQPLRHLRRTVLGRSAATSPRQGGRPRQGLVERPHARASGRSGRSGGVRPALADRLEDRLSPDRLRPGRRGGRPASARGAGAGVDTQRIELTEARHRRTARGRPGPARTPRSGPYGRPPCPRCCAAHRSGKSGHSSRSRSSALRGQGPYPRGRGGGRAHRIEPDGRARQAAVSPVPPSNGSGAPTSAPRTRAPTRGSRRRAPTNWPDSPLPSSPPPRTTPCATRATTTPTSWPTPVCRSSTSRSREPITASSRSPARCDSRVTYWISSRTPWPQPSTDLARPASPVADLLPHAGRTATTTVPTLREAAGPGLLGPAASSAAARGRPDR